MRRTKIVATLGPATRDPDVLKSLLSAGVDVARLNLAHADAATHLEASDAIREVSDQLDREAAVLVDLPGPKMRTGPIAGDEVALEPGQSFSLHPPSTQPGDSDGVSTTIDNLADLVEPGDDIFLADGAIILTVVNTDKGEVHTEVVRRGLLRSRKGMHVPRAETKIASFGRKDQDALDLALRCHADMVGVSFVRDARDIEEVRRALSRAVGSERHPLLVAKIETRSAVENLDAIIETADAVMVARGDLGIQMPFQEVPLLQKQIIATCNRAGVPVITATQMLESMTHSPLPSRAEVTDVANAVLDGTDALMLSEETAVGNYPVETVEAMHDIASAAEREGDPRLGSGHHKDSNDPVSWAIAHAAVLAAQELGATAIVCPTRSGATARRVASFRPRMPIIGLSDAGEVSRSMALVWGVVPITVPNLPGEFGTETFAHALDAARGSGLVTSGDLVAVVAGGSEPRAGATDLVRIVPA